MSMASRAIKPKRDGGIQAKPWRGIEERAPSIVRQQGPLFARVVAIISLMLITLGGAALLFNAWKWRYLISPSVGFFFVFIGMTGLLFHAFSEKDFQFRRLYGAFGLLLFLVAVVLRLAPLGEARAVGGQFLPYGALSLGLSLGFLLSFVKNETEIPLRTLALNLIGLIALANALAGFIGGACLSRELSESFLTQTGVVHLIIGLLFAAGYVGMEGISTPRGYWAGGAIGIFGAAMFLVALVRSLLPVIARQFNMTWEPPAFFLPSGLILMYLGAEYFAIYLGICSDNKLVVLTRRELGNFFYSPIAYIVMFGMAVVGWLNYWVFVLQLEEAASRGGQGLPEPIFFNFMASFLALIPMLFLVPILTMRLLSEEKRTGTLEVLLTAPVNEWHIVLAKFLAGLRIFMLCWYTWGVFFIALRLEGGVPFDYRPIITFMIALICMGAGFVAMGLFFSSITKHQIMAAVFTFVIMMALTLLFMVNRFFADIQWLNSFNTYVSYIDLWISSARATITPRLLVLNLSIAVFWLFLSIVVLGARKWT